MKQVEDPPAQKSSPKWTETFGNAICVLSLHLGLPPEEVAFLIAGVLGNLSGPTAGLIGTSNRRISPGFSILSVGEPDFRSSRLFDHLLAPAWGMQDVLRNHARRAHRRTVDLHCFGPGNVTEIENVQRNLGGLRDRCLRMLSVAEADLQRSDEILPNWDVPPHHNQVCAWGEGDEKLLNERLPGPKHRPTFIALTGDAGRVDELLSESWDQHLLVIDPNAGFFRGTFQQSSKSGNIALGRFARLLSGEDVAVPQLHPQQGFGRLQRAQIRVMASISDKALAEMAGSGDDAPRQVLSNSILWRPNWRHLREVGPDHGTSAWAVLKHAMLNVINFRIGNMGPCDRATKEDSLALERIEIKLFTELENQPAALRPLHRKFSSLVPTLFWAFSLVQREKEDWAMRATEATALYALRKHAELLRQAVDRAKHEKLTRIAAKVIGVLQEKGACAPRDLLRSVFQLRQSDLGPALDFLVRTERVGFDESSRRYRLIGSPAQ